MTGCIARLGRASAARSRCIPKAGHRVPEGEADQGTLPAGRAAQGAFGSRLQATTAVVTPARIRQDSQPASMGWLLTRPVTTKRPAVAGVQRLTR